MPIDFTKPSTTGNYSTGVLQPINDAMKALAQWLDPAVAGTLTSTPTGAYRINGGAVQRFDGTSWVGQPINGVTLSGGFVGIGGTPGTRLDVMDTVDTTSTVRTTGTSNAATLALSSGNGTTSGRFSYIRFLNAETTSQDWRLGTYGNANFTLRNQSTSTNIVIVDPTGNAGLGVAPSAWGTNFRSLQVGAVGSVTYDNNLGQVYIGTNFYMAGAGAGTPTYLTSNAAARFDVTQTGFQFRQVGSGTASSSFTWSTVARVDTAGIRPGTTGTQDLGSTSLRWNNAYANNVYATNVEVGGYKVFHSGNLKGRRNRIINGAFRVRQRYGSTVLGAFVTPYGSRYFADRWQSRGSGDTGALIDMRTVSSFITGVGRVMAFKLTTGFPAYTPPASDIRLIAYSLPPEDVSDFRFNEAGASTEAFTVSFWVNASVTGTYSFAVFIQQGTLGTDSQSYVSTYTISAANTWEYKTITIPATTGKSATLSAVHLIFSYAGGTSRMTSTLNTWSSSSVWEASGGVRLTETANATLMFANVQMEKGTQATAFEETLFAEDLLLCQRFFCKSQLYSESPEANTYTGSIAKSPDSTCSYMSFGRIPFPVEMQKAPTVQIYNPEPGGPYGTGRNVNAASNVAITVDSSSIGTTGFNPYVNNVSVTTGQLVKFHYAAEAELTFPY